LIFINLIRYQWVFFSYIFIWLKTFLIHVIFFYSIEWSIEFSHSSNTTLYNFICFVDFSCFISVDDISFDNFGIEDILFIDFYLILILMEIFSSLFCNVNIKTMMEFIVWIWKFSFINNFLYCNLFKQLILMLQIISHKIHKISIFFRKIFTDSLLNYIHI
jgi:hypothetical protein